MSSRIVVRGKTVWQTPGTRQPPKWSKALPRDRYGNPVDCASAIAPDEPASPFREGLVARDLDDGLNYRMVHCLNPADGWASVEFWMDRYKMMFKEVIRVVELGLLDPAMEAGSQVKRYRCRDEQRLRAHPEVRRMLKLGKDRRYDERLRAQRAKAAPKK